MPADRIGESSKEPSTVSGASFPPATEHHDGPERPPHEVPTAPDAPTGADPDQEDSDGA